jgi:hypothetical protein
VIGSTPPTSSSEKRAAAPPGFARLFQRLVEETGEADCPRAPLTAGHRAAALKMGVAQA